MKTLKQIAKDFNLYQLADIPAQWDGEYCRKDGGDTLPEFFSNLKGYESGNFFECKIQDKGTPKELYFIEYHTYNLIKKDGSDLLLMLKQDNRNKKYYLHPYYGLINKFHGINYEIKNRALKELKEPNYIGVFTEKKVSDWFKYCADYLATLENVLSEVNGKNQEIEKQISDFIASVPGCKVSTYQNTTDIDTPLFRVRFDHYKDQKFLSTKIDFRGTLADISAIENTVKEQI